MYCRIRTYVFVCLLSAPQLSSEIRPHSINHIQHLLRPYEQPARLGGHTVRTSGRDAAKPLLPPNRLELPAFTLKAAPTTLADSAKPVAVAVALAPHRAPRVVPKLPVHAAAAASTGATRAADIKVSHAAPCAVVPCPCVELVARPRIPHRHLDADPRSELALHFADIPRERAEACTLGRDNARNPHLERRSARGTTG